MDKEIIEKGLHATATNPERLTSFTEAGISQKVLAQSLGVTKPTIQKWQKGESMPKAPISNSIDDIRCVLAILVGRGLEADRAAKVIQMAPNGAKRSFLDVIVDDPIFAIQKAKDIGRRQRQR